MGVRISWLIVEVKLSAYSSVNYSSWLRKWNTFFCNFSVTSFMNNVTAGYPKYEIDFTRIL